MAHKNFISSVVFLITFIFCYIMCGTLKEQVQFYPKFICTLEIALCIIFLIKSFIEKKGEAKHDAVWIYDRLQTKKIIITVIMMFLYIELIQIVGFLITTVVFMFTFILINGSKENVKIYAIISIAFPVLVYIVFAIGFKFSLPTGILI